MIKSMISNRISDEKRIDLRRARWIRGITRQKMAQTLGVSLAKYVYWESFPEQMPLSSARLFAEAVELPLDVIFFGPNSTLSRKAKGKMVGRVIRKSGGKCLLCGEPIVITDCDGKGLDAKASKKAKNRDSFHEPSTRLYDGAEPFGYDGVCGECLTAHRAAMEKSNQEGAASSWDSLVDFAKYLVEQFGSDRKEGIPWMQSR